MYKLFRLSFLMIVLVSATVFVKSGNFARGVIVKSRNFVGANFARRAASSKAGFLHGVGFHVTETSVEGAGVGCHVPADLVNHVTEIGILEAQLKRMEAEPGVSKEELKSLKVRIDCKELMANNLMNLLTLPGCFTCQWFNFRSIANEITARAKEEELARGQGGKKEGEFRSNNEREDRPPSVLELAQWNGFDAFWDCLERRYRIQGYSKDDCKGAKEHQDRVVYDKYFWYGRMVWQRHYSDQLKKAAILRAVLIAESALDAEEHIKK